MCLQVIHAAVKVSSLTLPPSQPGGCGVGSHSQAVGPAVQVCTLSLWLRDSGVLPPPTDTLTSWSDACLLVTVQLRLRLRAAGAENEPVDLKAGYMNTPEWIHVVRGGLIAPPCALSADDWLWGCLDSTLTLRLLQ